MVNVRDVGDRRYRVAGLAGLAGRGWLAALVVALVVASIPAAVAAQARPPWRSPVPELPTTTVTVGDDPLVVELALTPEARSRGLGYRPGLAPGTGMLFVDDEQRPQSFWMKGMRFCLDIVWIEGGRIVGAAESVCPDPPGTADAERARFQSPVPVSYVLEVPAGWLAANGHGPGTRVVIEAPSG